MISFVYNPDDQKEKAGDESDKDEDKEKKSKNDKPKVQLEILDDEDHIIRSFKVEVEPGLNRAFWELRRKGVLSTYADKPKDDAAEPRGPKVTPGTYKVRLISGEHQDTTQVKVLLDPRIEVAAKDLAEREQLVQAWMEAQQTIRDVAVRLKDAVASVELVMTRLKEREDQDARSLKDESRALKKDLKALLETINQKEVQGILRDPGLVGNRVRGISSYMTSSHEAPNATDRLALTQAEAAVKQCRDEVDAFFNEHWQVYKQKVEQTKVSFFND